MIQWISLLSLAHPFGSSGKSIALKCAGPGLARLSRVDNSWTGKRRDDSPSKYRIF